MKSKVRTRHLDKALVILASSGGKETEWTDGNDVVPHLLFPCISFSFSFSLSLFLATIAHPVDQSSRRTHCLVLLSIVHYVSDPLGDPRRKDRSCKRKKAQGGRKRETTSDTLRHVFRIWSCRDDARKKETRRKEPADVEKKSEVA